MNHRFQLFIIIILIKVELTFVFWCDIFATITIDKPYALAPFKLWCNFKINGSVIWIITTKFAANQPHQSMLQVVKSVVHRAQKSTYLSNNN